MKLSSIITFYIQKIINEKFVRKKSNTIKLDAAYDELISNLDGFNVGNNHHIQDCKERFLNAYKSNRHRFPTHVYTAIDHFLSTVKSGNIYTDDQRAKAKSDMINAIRKECGAGKVEVPAEEYVPNINSASSISSNDKMKHPTNKKTCLQDKIDLYPPGIIKEDKRK